jgi:hypothetical protein
MRQLGRRKMKNDMGNEGKKARMNERKRGGGRTKWEGEGGELREEM